MQILRIATMQPFCSSPSVLGNGVRSSKARATSRARPPCNRGALLSLCLACAIASPKARAQSTGLSVSAHFALAAACASGERAFYVAYANQETEKFGKATVCVRTATYVLLRPESLFAVEQKLARIVKAP